MKSATRTSKKSATRTSNKRIKNELIDFIIYFEREAEIQLNREQKIILIDLLEMFKDNIQTDYFVRINQAVSAVRLKN